MTLVIAHRGSGDPENSLAAFRQAIDIGADMIEFDIRRSGDGQLVLIHDEKVDGVEVSQLTYRQLTDRLGRQPALLEQLLELAQGQIGLNAEIKDPAALDTTLPLLNQFTGPLITSSFEAQVIEEVKRFNPQLQTGLLALSLADLLPTERIKESGADYLISHFSIVGAQKIAREAGLPLICWTVNNRYQLEKMILNDQLFAVISDDSQRALAIRQRQIILTQS